MKKIIQKIVIKSNNIKLFHELNKKIYFFGLKIFIKIFSKLPLVSSIYLRRSMLKKEIVPGSSDVDLAIIIQDTDLEQEKLFMKRFLKKYFLLKKIFPFLGEVVILSKSEIKRWLKHGGSHSNEALETWKLLFGKKVIFGNPKKNLKSEFSRAMTIYLHFLLKEYLTNDLDKNYCRNIYKYYEEIIKHLEACGWKKTSDFKLLDKDFKKLKQNNFFSKESEEFILRTLCIFVKPFKKTAEKVLKGFKPQKKMEHFNLCFDYPQGKFLLEKMVPFFKESHLKLSSFVDDFMFSSAGYSRYKYRFDVILKNDLSFEDLNLFFKGLKFLYQKHKKFLVLDYWDSFKPVQVLPLEAFNFNLVYAHGWPSLELFYLEKYGYSFYNKKRDFRSLKKLFDISGFKADISFFPAYHRMLAQSKNKKTRLLLEDLFFGYIHFSNALQTHSNIKLRRNLEKLYFEMYDVFCNFYSQIKKDL
ncbi:MAG: hypothetical protein ABIC91_04430 [Nanoarchaeota archaeon]|nr:hypothetical protein [Nanoarchaeota archaeon]